MNKHYTFWLPLLLFMMASCSTTKKANVLDRTAIPEVRADVPAGTSEIREIKFHNLASEKGHEVLHLQGLLFAKNTTGSSTEIRPCVGCVIRLASPADPSITANLVTADDGYFSFNGKILPYTLTFEHAGMNPLVIENVEFLKEGIMTMKVIQAMGSSPERFRVARRGYDFSWTKVQ